MNSIRWKGMMHGLGFSLNLDFTGILLALAAIILVIVVFIVSLALSGSRHSIPRRMGARREARRVQHVVAQEIAEEAAQKAASVEHLQGVLSTVSDSAQGGLSPTLGAKTPEEDQES
ncbi:MAG: hypothetical protein ACI9U2_005158 [Bradymonadia bacterium]|jgi:hypothetical protein